MAGSSVYTKYHHRSITYISNLGVVSLIYIESIYRMLYDTTGLQITATKNSHI